jgi:kelch-like protein 19
MFTIKSCTADLDTVNFDDLKDSIMNENGFNGIEYETLSIDDSHSRLLFKSTNFRVDFFKNMQELFVAEKFCDVALRSENKIIKCHKLVLAAASPYFKCMFTGGFKENETCEQVDMDQVCSFAILDSIVNFIYSGRVVVSESNAQNMLVASKILQINDLDNVCGMFLFLNLDVSNCIGIDLFAKEYGCIWLSK